jgi:hypothetical protein
MSQKEQPPTKDAVDGVGATQLQQTIPADDPFRNANAARDFFKKKDRSRPFELQDVSEVRYEICTDKRLITVLINIL